MNFQALISKKSVDTFEAIRQNYSQDLNQFIAQLFHSPINPLYVLTIFLNTSVFNSYFAENVLLYIRVLEAIYNSDKAYVISDMLTLECINDNSRFFICAYLASKDSLKYIKEKQYVENALTDVLPNIIKSDVDSKKLNIINDILYYKGDNNYIFKGMVIDNLELYEDNLRAYLTACYLISNHSSNAFNFVRVCAMLFSHLSFPVIYKLREDDIDHLFKFIEDFKLHKKSLYDWIVKNPYYYEKVDMENLYNLDRNLFISAAQKCVPEEEAKLHLSTGITNIEKLQQLLPDCSATMRINLVEYIFNLNPANNYAILFDYLEDSSKLVVDKIIELLKGYIPCHKTVCALLNHPMLAVRQSAVKILEEDENSYILDALNNALTVEKNDDLRDYIRGVLNVSLNLVLEEIDLFSFCKKAIGANRLSTLYWLDIDTLPAAKYKNNRVAESELTKYLLLCYASNKTNNNEILELVVSKLSKYDLANLAYEVMLRWGNIDYDIKRKWVLTFVAVFGDNRTLEIIERNMMIWNDQSRAAIACEAIKSLTLSTAAEAIEVIRNSSNIKNVKIKKACKLALEKLEHH